MTGGKAIKEGPIPIEENAMAMSSDDISFLIDCLKCPIGGGVVSIDTKAVAEARGLKNAGSVANRITKLKRKFNLPISATLSRSRKLSESPATDAKVPVTPNKNKVTKTRGTRGRAVKVTKKTAKLTTSGSEESDADDEDKGVIYKAPKVSDEEDGEDDDDVAEDNEDGEDMEEPETIKVEDEHHDEV